MMKIKPWFKTTAAAESQSNNSRRHQPKSTALRGSAIPPRSINEVNGQSTIKPQAKFQNQ